MFYLLTDCFLSKSLKAHIVKEAVMLFVAREANFTHYFSLISFGFDSLVELLMVMMMFDQAGQEPENDKTSNSEELVNSYRNFILWKIHYWSRKMQSCFMHVWFNSKSLKMKKLMPRTLQFTWFWRDIFHAAVFA